MGEILYHITYIEHFLTWCRRFVGGFLSELEGLELVLDEDGGVRLFLGALQSHLLVHLLLGNLGFLAEGTQSGARTLKVA